jgi:hypothetical protein
VTILADMPDVDLQTGPLLKADRPDVFYFAGSYLYLHNPDAWTGVFDDPEIPQNDLGRLALVAHPNPFNAAITLTWFSGTPVSSLAVHNILGQTVKSVDASSLDGALGFTWDGHDSNGREVASGVYFARIVTREGTATTKIVLLR